MNARLAAAIVVVLILGGCSPSCDPIIDSQAEKDEIKVDLNELPAIDRPFKAAPCMRAAALLQQMGKQKGCVQLAKLAEQDDYGRVAVMCRLVFSKKRNTFFRPPH